MEQAFINYLVHNTIIEALVTIQYYLFSRELLDVKKKNRSLLLVVCVCKFLLYNVVTLLIRNIYGESIYLSAVNSLFVVFFVVGLKMISGKPYLQVLLSVILTEPVSLLTCLTPYIVIYQQCTQSDRLLEGPFGLYMIAGIAVSLLLITVGYKLMGRWLRRQPFAEMRFKPFWYLVIAVYYGGTIIHSGMANVNTTGWFFLYFLGLCAAWIVIGYGGAWLARRAEDARIQKEKQILKIEQSAMKEYYDTLNSQLERTREFQANIEMHMQTLKTLVSQHGENQQMQQYVKELEETYSKMLPLNYCDELVINALLTNEEAKCQKEGIALTIGMKEFQLSKVKEIDMVAIFVSLFDKIMELMGEHGADERKKDDAFIRIESGIAEEGRFTELICSANLFEVDLKQIKEILKKYEGSVTREGMHRIRLWWQ